jgi:hypothetical protein
MIRKNDQVLCNDQRLVELKENLNIEEKVDVDVEISMLMLILSRPSTQDQLVTSMLRRPISTQGFP